VHVKEVPCGGQAKLAPVRPGFISITHSSLLEPNLLAIRTDGVVAHTGDLKIDPNRCWASGNDTARTEKTGQMRGAGDGVRFPTMQLVPGKLGCAKRRSARIWPR